MNKVIGTLAALLGLIFGGGIASAAGLGRWGRPGFHELQGQHHDAFTSNIFRIGINYWFNYWDKP
jgi:hypothetical protein